jgi:hypothetical protein
MNKKRAADKGKTMAYYDDSHKKPFNLNVKSPKENMRVQPSESIYFSQTSSNSR